ncbi:MAG: hypothetical protein ACYT04_90070, partial [Nostoc sp.]
AFNQFNKLRVRDAINLLKESYTFGLEVGDFVHIIVATFFRLFYTYLISGEKLEILLAELRSQQVLLVHSDLKLINSDDETIHPSTWDFEGRNPEKATVELLLLR